ncbi:hypothetical protein CIF41_01840 [Campylobacter jejuni]|nr:hypothetical protein [Campylobacter jejuni]
MIFFIIILGACLGSFCTSLASRIIEKKPFFISRSCRRKNKISIWKNKTSIKVEILFFYKP